MNISYTKVYNTLTEKSPVKPYIINGTDIIIYKEAKIQITNINQPRLFGYDEEVDISNINYVPITGTFSAMVNFNKKQKLRDVREVNSFVEQGEASIKVKSDARDFIENDGKTINISIFLVFSIILSKLISF